MRKNVALFASQDLVEMLASMKHEIAYILSENIRYRSGVPITYLDFGSKNDTISFIYHNKLSEIQREYGDSYKDYVWNSKRSEMKIGKIIKLIYGNNFPINQQKGTIRRGVNNDIESFVNMFKSLRDKQDNKNNFELVKGKYIRYWYNQENYSRFIKEDTTLAKSCLRYEESGKFLEIYVNNPDIFSLLILKDDANKLRGRAIVWNLDQPKGRIFMDRFYTVNDSDVELYKHFATEQGWLYKKRQTFGYDHYIVDSKTGEEKMFDQLLLKVKLKTPPKKYYPYLDTLSVYNRDEYTLCNDGRLLRKPPHLRLTDYQGSYIDEADYREMVYSNFYGQEIPREESDHVSIDDDWVYSHEVVHVHNTNGRTSHRNSERIKKSVILGKTKYFLTEDCIYSEYLSTYIYKESVREVYVDLEKTTKGLVHKKMLGKNRLFEEDKDGDYVLTIINIVKESKIDIDSKEYNEIIKIILKNGRSDIRQILTSDLIVKYIKQKRNSKSGSSMFGLTDDLYNKWIDLRIPSSHHGYSSGRYDNGITWVDPSDGVNEVRGNISEIRNGLQGSFDHPESLIDRDVPEPRPVRRRRTSNPDRNIIDENSIVSADPPSNDRVIVERRNDQGQYYFEVREDSENTESEDNIVERETNDEENIIRYSNSNRSFFSFDVEDESWININNDDDVIGGDSNDRLI